MLLNLKRYLKKLWCIYSFGIILLVTLPINGDGQVFSHLNDVYIVRVRLDYISHFILFMPWTCLTIMLFAKKRAGLNTVILLRILLFAIFSEVVQYSLPYRTFNINDLASNLMGVLLGLLLAECIKRIPF